MVQRLKNWIGGEWLDASSDRTEPVYNPATEELLAHVPLSAKEDVERAANSAKEAFRTWSRTPVPKRARILFKYQQLLVDHWEELAGFITRENGKSYNEAHG
ncbi:MAG: methylmalonate-semialdehyde dehydrogenase, partial [Paenibacillus sp.]|nr:methylmalonate-semialdehyde dehydrogenase [Paenibacillus sp.]